MNTSGFLFFFNKLYYITHLGSMKTNGENRLNIFWKKKRFYEKVFLFLFAKDHMHIDLYYKFYSTITTLYCATGEQG